MGRKGDDNILNNNGGSASGSGMNKQYPPRNLTKPRKTQEPGKTKTKVSTTQQMSKPVQRQNNAHVEKYTTLLTTVYESLLNQPSKEGLHNAVLQFHKHWQFVQRGDPMTSKEFFGGVKEVTKLFADITKTKIAVPLQLPDVKVDVGVAKATPATKRLETIRIINWDVGMLLLKGFAFRVRALVKLLQEEDFDIIMLQELNPIVAQFLENHLQSRYLFFYGRQWEKDQFFDFTATLVRNNTFETAQSKVLYFSNTGQQRALLRTELTIGKEKLVLFNTHLEYLSETSKTRCQQLKKYFNDASSLSSDAYVIISGSLHARDWEVDQIPSMADLWETLGTPENEFTWDLQLNKLIQIKNLTPNVQPRKRFDRIYFINSKHYSGPRIVARTFDLVGQNAVAFGKYCVSDHYGIVVQFDTSKCY